MKKHHKIISLFLTLITVLSVFNIVPLTVSAIQTNSAVNGSSADEATEDEATEDESLSGNTGWDGCTWKLKGTVLTISGNGHMGDYNWEYRTPPWGTGITEVIIEDGVTGIGEYAFNNCTNLTRVIIPDSVISIGESAFKNCTNLRNIDIPDSVTDIDYNAFSYTAWYNSQPEGVVYAGRVAYNYKGSCPETVSLREGTTGIAGRAFDRQENLKSIVIPDSVISIETQAFSQCTNLTSVTIPASLKNIETEAFSRCTSLERVEISDIEAWCNIGGSGFWYGNPLGLADNLYLNGELVTELIIPDSVTTINRFAFGGFTCITSVKIPESVSIINRGTFSGCTNLTSVWIPESVTKIGDGDFDPFRGCDNLTDIYYAGSKAGWKKIEINDYKLRTSNIHYGRDVSPDELYNYRVQTDGTAIITDYFGSEKELNIPGAIDGYLISAIQYEAFWCNDSTESVILPDSIKNIGNYAFAHSSINKVVILEGVEKIGYAAFWDNPMQEITIPASVTYIGEKAIGYSGDIMSYPIEGFIIQGYKGTAAEAYAIENGFTFVPLREEVKPGDADGDGVVTSIDVTNIQRFCASIETGISNDVLMYADVDQSGAIEITDATFIQRWLAGIDIPYTIG